MPTYTLLNTETDETTETFCTWSELDSFLEEHPTFKSIVLTAPALVSGVAGRSFKTDDGFKENMARISEAHPNSPLADQFGTNKDIKTSKTNAVLKKHKVKSIGKSHDLNNISKEYKSGELVK
jgi:hypothetical protein